MKKIKILFAFSAIVLILIGCNSENKKNETQKEPIKIGSILPLTGDKSAYGLSMKNSIDLAIDEINSKNFVENAQFSVIFEDSKGLPKESTSSFQKLATVDKVAIVLGPMSSAEALSIAPIAEEKHVVILSPSASSPSLTNAGDYFFRTAPSDVYEGNMIAIFASDTLKLKRVAILFINSEYGIGVVGKFKEKFSADGGIIVASESYSEGTLDFRTQLGKLKASSPEAFYFVGYKELGKIVKQASELGITAKYLSVSLFEDPDILTTAGKSAEGVIFPSISFNIKNNNPRVNQFVSAFSKKYGKEPDAFAASAYDATYIMAEAVKKAGNDASKIKDALYGIKKFPGLLGDFDFDSNGDVILPLTLKMVKDGKFVNYY